MSLFIGWIQLNFIKIFTVYKRQHQGTDSQAAYCPIRQNSQSHQNINKQFYSWIQKINLIDIN